VSDRWVLMYHRICERGPDTQCWFERGTAVTPAALERQLAWLSERFAIVPLEALHAPMRTTKRSRIAITFDDGYADTLELAAPICARFGAAPTCFACAGPARGGPALWFDIWYAIVHAGLAADHWNATLRRHGLPAAADLRACVGGDVKHWLTALPPDTRDSLLQDLATELGAAPAPRYLDLDGLRALGRLGWRIGGHGIDHAQLPDCDEVTLAAELRASRCLLADLDDSGAPCFAYPNGAFSERVVRTVAAAGFDFACTVERAPWTDASAHLTIPRVFCRGDEPVPHPLLVTS
jgi:peptidoglycan/xylan/chitin deacetylase (PgdA/CDA1 family)